MKVITQVVPLKKEVYDAGPAAILERLEGQPFVDVKQSTKRSGCLFSTEDVFTFICRERFIPT